MASLELLNAIGDLETAEYMTVSLDGSRHPALLALPGTGITYDQKSKRWIFEAGRGGLDLQYDEIYRPCFQARDELLATVNKYQKKLKQPLFSIETRHSWTEVDECVQDACNGLKKLELKDKDQSGSLGRVKRAFRSLCQHAGTGQTFANIIPNDTFLLSSVMCGAMKVIFTGLRHTAIYREEVYRTLEHLPYVLEDHAANLKIYNQDEELHMRAAALYVAVFKLQNHILLWFLGNTFVSGVKILTDPMGYTDKLRDYKAEVQITAQRFEAQATKLSRRVQDESMQLQCWATYIQGDMHKQLQTIIERQNILNERYPRLDALEKLNSFLNNIMTDMKQRSLISDRNRVPTKTTADMGPEILKRFLYEPEMIPNDCMKILRASRARKPADQLATLQSNVRLVAWLTVNESSLLLLNGRESPRTDCAVSVFSAKLVAHLLEQHEAFMTEDHSSVDMIPLAFFCGQHQDSYNDFNSSPEELAMSLFLQLVHRSYERIDAAVLRRCYKRTQGGNIDSICASLESIIQNLRHDVVLILIVDGLRFFTRPPERSEGTRTVVAHLVRIFRNQPAATLKFLFTSPTRSDFLEDLFLEDELLDIPRNGPSTASPTMIKRSLGPVQ